MYACVCVCMCVRMYVCPFVCNHASTYVCPLSVYFHFLVIPTHTCIPICLHTYLPTYIPTYIHTCMHISIHNCKDIHIRTYTYTYTYIYIYIRIYIYGHTSVHTYVAVCSRLTEAWEPQATAVYVQLDFPRTLSKTYWVRFINKRYIESIPILFAWGVLQMKVKSWSHKVECLIPPTL